MPHRYPQEAVLRDGRRVFLRPFAEKDVDALYDFFHRMPLEYRRFAWDNVDNRSLIESWGRSVDYAKVQQVAGAGVPEPPGRRQGASEGLGGSIRCRTPSGGTRLV